MLFPRIHLLHTFGVVHVWKIVFFIGGQKWPQNLSKNYEYGNTLDYK